NKTIAADYGVLLPAGLARGKLSFFSTQNLPALPLLMPGLHNQSNARAALAVVEALAASFPTAIQIDYAAARQAICNFKGLAHRLELVHTSHIGARQIRWYNDSKATTPEASLTALEAFTPAAGGKEKPHAIFIVGGYDKHIDMSAFERRLAQHAAGVLGIGQTGPALIDHIRAAGMPADRCEYVETLDRATARAWQWAKELSASVETPAIVLSPASASWGQFTNYEERGVKFAELAKAVT
ncbi:MAG: hypothetical protein WCI73_15140, partial [Phycisphaerae bacterium]